MIDGIKIERAYFAEQIEERDQHIIKLDFLLVEREEKMNAIENDLFVSRMYSCKLLQVRGRQEPTMILAVVMRQSCQGRAEERENKSVYETFHSHPTELQGSIVVAEKRC